MNNLIELDLGIFPEAAVSGAVLVQTEYFTVLTFNAKRPTNRIGPFGRYREDAGIAIFRFNLCRATRFGYPNDEARCGIPRYQETDYAIYEVRNSSWVQETLRDNRYQFPQTPDSYAGKHLLFTFHDSTFECLTDDFEFEVSTEPYEVIFDRIRQEVLERQRNGRISVVSSHESIQ